MAFSHHKNKGALRPSLADIFSSADEFGLLNVETKKSSYSSSPEVGKFEEISAFVDQHGRQPSTDGDLREKLLARRLKGYQQNHGMHPLLIPFDRHGLLPDLGELEGDLGATHDEVATAINTASEEFTSLDDIFSSASFSEFDLGDTSILSSVNVEFNKSADPDEVAQRRVCKDFYQFESTFNQLHDDLKSGKASAIRFIKGSQVQTGDAFIMDGVICIVDEVGEYREEKDGRYNPRLRLIFENGTESNHLLRSLSKRLYKEETGRRIIQDGDSVAETFNNITQKDKRSGQIYFVTTKSDNPVLSSIPNLIKIGYTELTVEERTKNAINDPAFLESPVKILASMECYNLNPNKFETLIHGFLHSQRLKVTLTGKNGKAYHPNEWFSVPLDTAREVVRRIIDGSIVHYRIDNTTGKMVMKKGW
ncbi:GIY-YIG nuclease family protein [Leclercia adecarboxylata]|uniref:GIY-YIG nuclease family protein n=1 Tax=Leclercia adecarboxylata TaxID=83655 RepID=UPI00124BEB16|nr:GIY-YIG nuclease family protein [Leclercia adecarboxylata]QFH51544.1 GIY-YIG nuclease family protein [Leclercia adecarboxylata]